MVMPPAAEGSAKKRFDMYHLLPYSVLLRAPEFLKNSGIHRRGACKRREVRGREQHAQTVQ